MDNTEKNNCLKRLWSACFIFLFGSDILDTLIFLVFHIFIEVQLLCNVTFVTSVQHSDLTTNIMSCSQV